MLSMLSRGRRLQLLYNVLAQARGVTRCRRYDIVQKNVNKTTGLYCRLSTLLPLHIPVHSRVAAVISQRNTNVHHFY